MATQGAEVRHHPTQVDKFQQALHEPRRLPQRQAKQHLHRQTRLDRRVAEARLPAAFAGLRRSPCHFWIKPNRQRSAPLQTFIVSRPVRGLVLRGGPTTHAITLDSRSESLTRCV
jgi:hypothetical protein